MEKSFADRVSEELAKARAKHSDMNSPHEAYAVILEELDEFWDLVKADDHQHSDGKTRMINELVQIGAMAQRAAEDVLGVYVPWPL